MARTASVPLATGRARRSVAGRPLSRESSIPVALSLRLRTSSESALSASEYQQQQRPRARDGLAHESIHEGRLRRRRISKVPARMGMTPIIRRSGSSGTSLYRHRERQETPRGTQGKTANRLEAPEVPFCMMREGKGRPTALEVGKPDGTGEVRRSDHWLRLRWRRDRLPSGRGLSGLDSDHRAGAGAGGTRLWSQRRSGPAVGCRRCHSRRGVRQRAGVREAPVRAGLSPDRIAPPGDAGPAGGSARDESGRVVAPRGRRGAPARSTSRGTRLRGGPGDAWRRRDRYLGAAPALPGGRPQGRRDGAPEL